MFKVNPAHTDSSPASRAGLAADLLLLGRPLGFPLTVTSSPPDWLTGVEAATSSWGWFKLERVERRRGGSAATAFAGVDFLLGILRYEWRTRGKIQSLRNER